MAMLCMFLLITEHPYLFIGERNMTTEKKFVRRHANWETMQLRYQFEIQQM